MDFSKLGRQNLPGFSYHLPTTELIDEIMSGFIGRWGEGGKRCRQRQKHEERSREGFTGKRQKAEVQWVMRAAGLDTPWG